MARSRSLFDDLEFAIATATSLAAGDDPKSSSQFIPSAPLVSFDMPVPSIAGAAVKAEVPEHIEQVELAEPAERVEKFEREGRTERAASVSRAERAESVPRAERTESVPRAERAESVPRAEKAESVPRAAASAQPAAPRSAEARPSAPMESQKATIDSSAALTPSIQRDRPVARAPQTLVTRVPELPPEKPPSRQPAPEPGAIHRETTAPPAFDALGEKKVPPKLPDLSSISSPVVRCEKIVEWIADATGATDVFLADSGGYPLAGAIKDVEAKLASVGVVASAVSSLAASIPGNVSPLFELHMGEGPVFQLVGFKAGASVYIVGFSRGAPLTPRQSHAIRLACRHALGDTLRGGLWETE